MNADADADDARDTRTRAVFALTLAVAACSPTPAAVPAPATPPPSTTATPSEEPSPTAEPAPSEAESEPIIGIAACDRYLAAYQKCEPKLSPEIQAGDRRTYEAEKNWLVFMKTSPEGKGLEAACQSMIAELTKSCE